MSFIPYIEFLLGLIIARNLRLNTAIDVEFLMFSASRFHSDSSGILQFAWWFHKSHQKMMLKNSPICAVPLKLILPPSKQTISDE